MLTQLSSQLQQRLTIEIADFCQHWQIAELAVFGSILQDDFHVNSDIDLLLKFSPQARQGLLTLAKLKHDLEDKTGRKVDIALKESVENSKTGYTETKFSKPRRWFMNINNQYDRVNANTLWEVIQTDIPELLRCIENLL